MAKLSIVSKAQRIREAESVRRVRERYEQALKLGHSNQDAAKLAQSNEPIKPKITEAVSKPSAPAPQRGDAAPVEKPKSISISGHAGSSEQVEVKTEPEAVFRGVEIPPTWQDLPWVQLRKLAVQISGRPVGSRKNAIDVIEGALANRQASS